MNRTIAAQVGRETEGQTLLDAFYRARGYVVDRSVAGREFDLALERDGTHFLVEEKIRSAAYSDVLLELIQDVPSGNRGWFYTEEFDYLVYAVVSGRALRRVTIIDWPRFRKWLGRVYFDRLREQRRRPSLRVSLEGYGVTVNMVVPMDDIPVAYLKVFAADELTEAAPPPTEAARTNIGQAIVGLQQL